MRLSPTAFADFARDTRLVVSVRAGTPGNFLNISGASCHDAHIERDQGRRPVERLGGRQAPCAAPLADAFDHARDLHDNDALAPSSAHGDARLAVDIGIVDIMIEGATAQRVGEFARAVGGQHHMRNCVALTVPSSGSRPRSRTAGRPGTPRTRRRRDRSRRSAAPRLLRDGSPPSERALAAGIFSEMSHPQQCWHHRRDRPGSTATAAGSSTRTARPMIDPLVSIAADQFGPRARKPAPSRPRSCRHRLAFQQRRGRQLHQRQRDREFAVGDVARRPTLARSRHGFFIGFSRRPSWFETREDTLLTVEVLARPSSSSWSVLILRSGAPFSRRLEDEAPAPECAHETLPDPSPPASCARNHAATGYAWSPGSRRCIVDGVGERRHAADIRALADALGAIG